MATRWTIGARGPDPRQLREIAAVLQGGGVVLAPTDTIYGLHAVARDPAAVEKIFQIKGRPAEKSLPVLFGSFEQLREIGIVLSNEVEQGLQKIWPAPLTAILPLQVTIAATAGANTIAARIPKVDWLRRLIEQTGPIASTSANRSGEAPLKDPAALPEELAMQLDGMVDAGPVPGAASTIVDFTQSPPVLVRSGEFFFSQNLWKKSRISL